MKTDWTGRSAHQGAGSSTTDTGSSLDPFFSLKVLAHYSGLSVRKLRDCLDDSVHPLPHYRVGGKILVRRSEFDAWIGRFRQEGRVDVEYTVRRVLAELQP